jgi:hypothetical protein
VAREDRRSNKAAKIAYRPVGLVSGLIGGALAGIIFKQIWRHVRGDDEAPGALESEYDFREILIAAAVQGAIFAVIKAAVDRGGARAFERWTGEWPGD